MSPVYEKSDGRNEYNLFYFLVGVADVRDLKEKESFSIEQDFAIDPTFRWFHFDKQFDP
jgi:hypothetical protein